MTGRLARGSIVVLVSAAYFAGVFQLRSGAPLTAGLTDWIDPYFINAILEHWHHSVRHFTDPASPPMFFPVRGTLGYSVGLILYAPVYLVVRPFLHPFQAYNLTLFLVMELGSVCLYRILRRFAGLRFGEALLLCVFFFTSGNQINWSTGVWSQTLSVFLIPPILLTGLVSARRPDGRATRVMAWGAGLLATLLFTQDFYTAQFALFVSTVLLAGALVLAPDPAVWERVRVFWRGHRPWMLALSMGAFTGVMVFLWIYLEASREHPAFPADQLWRSLVQLDPSRWRSPADVMRNVASYMSQRSFILVLVVGVLAWLPWCRVDRNTRRYGLWFMLVSLLVFVLPLRTSDFSIWTSFFAPLPGLSVLRDPKRIIGTFELAVVLVTGLFVARLPPRSLLRIATSLLALVLIVAEWNPYVFEFRRRNDVFDRWVSAPIAIDPSCRSFFIAGASNDYMSRSGHMWSLYGLDALFIALDHSIPTLNGYTAWEAPNWELANPQGPGYLPAVTAWIERHRLQGVCALDIDKRTMTPYRPAPPSVAGGADP